jgi:hypothetical protein
MLKIKMNYRFWVKLTFIYFLIQNIVRTVFIIDNAPRFLDTVDVYLDGLLWDCFAWSFLSLPLMLVTFIFKDETHGRFLK